VPGDGGSCGGLGPPRTAFRPHRNGRLGRWKNADQQRNGLARAACPAMGTKRLSVPEAAAYRILRLALTDLRKAERALARSTNTPLRMPIRRRTWPRSARPLPNSTYSSRRRTEPPSRAPGGGAVTQRATAVYRRLVTRRDRNANKRPLPHREEALWSRAEVCLDSGIASPPCSMSIVHERTARSIVLHAGHACLPSR